MDFFRILAIGLLSIHMFSALGYAQNKPNIILIISDDHSYQTIGAYGNKLVQTPNIDKIAKEGVVFNKAYVTNSICGPSRAAILTGTYSHKNGVIDNKPQNKLDGSQDNFAKQLQKAGYQTAWIGKWHLGSDPTGFSFWKILPGQGDYYNPDFITASGKEQKQGYIANVVEDEAEAWLNSVDKSKPFCLVVGHKSAHRNWMPDTVDLGAYDNTVFPLPHNFYDNYENREAAQRPSPTIGKIMKLSSDLKMYDYAQPNKAKYFKGANAAQEKKLLSYYKGIWEDFKAKNLKGKALTEWKYQRYMRDYLSTINGLDRNIGRMLDYLQKKGLEKNTVVIYMSDQGFYMGEHGWFDKRWMYEESFRTPMIVKYPGTVKPGSKANGMVLNLDVAPTLLDIAKAPIPHQMQGKSFLPLITGATDIGYDILYYHYYEQEFGLKTHFAVKTDC